MLLLTPAGACRTPDVGRPWPPIVAPHRGPPSREFVRPFRVFCRKGVFFWSSILSFSFFPTRRPPALPPLSSLLPGELALLYNCPRAASVVAQAKEPPSRMPALQIPHFPLGPPLSPPLPPLSSSAAAPALPLGPLLVLRLLAPNALAPPGRCFVNSGLWPRPHAFCRPRIGTAI